MNVLTVIAIVWGLCAAGFAVLIRLDYHATRAAARTATREERPRGVSAPPPAHPDIVAPYSDWVSTRILAEMGSNYAKYYDGEPLFDGEDAAVAAALASPRKGGGGR